MSFAWWAKPDNAQRLAIRNLYSRVSPYFGADHPRTSAIIQNLATLIDAWKGAEAIDVLAHRPWELEENLDARPVRAKALAWTLPCALMEARAGIEPAFEDLQSSASPFCHRAAFDP